MEELIEITGSTVNLTIKLSELYLRSEQFDEVIEINLDELEPHLNGPFTPTPIYSA